MSKNKLGYWDVQQCRWVGGEAAYVVPPVSSAALPADPAVPADAAGPMAETVPGQRSPSGIPADGEPSITSIA